jgi:hypothetical protein
MKKIFLSITICIVFTSCYFSNAPVFFGPDAFHLAKTSPLVNQVITGMATDGEMIAAVTISGNIAWSEDHGINWYMANFATNEIDSRSFNAVTWGEGYFFTGGKFGNAAWSTDGKVWHDGVIGPMNPEHIHAVSAGKFRQQSVFMAGGTNGRIAYAVGSPLGPWFQVAFSPFGDKEGSGESIHSIAHGKIKGSGIFVAVGDNGNVAVMIDFSGNLYGPSAAGTRNNFYGISFGNDRFIAAGEGAALIISADPKSYSWKQIRDTSFKMQPFSIIEFSAILNYFILISDNSIIRYSEFGESWTALNFSSLFPGGITAITCTNKRIILSGIDGRIYYSN